MGLKDIFSKPNGAGDLKLSEYNSIRTRFCFLDESGSLSDPKEPFFTVGFLKCSQSYYLQGKIMYERTKRNFYDEMKFNKLSRNNIDFAKFALDSFFSTQSLFFCSYTLDKQGVYFDREFSGNPWQAYEDISIRVLECNIPQNEIIIVIADYITTPKDIKFEVNVKRKINEKNNRLAIAGVCRFDSKANDLLQLADLMVGAINYDLKLSTGLILRGDKNKRHFLEHFKKNLGIPNFLNGFRNFSSNIFVDKDINRRLPLKFADTNEKEPSS
jgi:hypothetical protein